MIVPCIDLQGGRVVQLIEGEREALDGGDPFDLAARFATVGEIAVVDLDAAKGEGSNADLVRTLVATAPCRVGGGIRDAETARAWLDAGATKVVLGTAARSDVLRALPRERVIAALDARDGEVVVEGWRTRTGQDVFERIEALRDHVGGLLVTVVEREGRMLGADLQLAERLRERAGDLPITFAGGIRTADEITALDRLGIDAQVGMAIYTGELPLADAFAAPLRSDRADALWPTVVCDERGTALGLCYSSLRSLTAAIDERRGIYESRTRGLWRKGESSGATQELLRIDADCDRDALRFTVKQHGAGFCHLDTSTCWGNARGLAALETALRARRSNAPAGSYTRRLLDDPELLRAKLVEEAGELADAQDPRHIAHEAADVLYFALVALARAGVDVCAAEAELDRRALRLTRRPGDAKDAPA